MNYVVRLTLPYSDCSGIVASWSSRSSQVVVFEHPADKQVKRTHCHIGLWNVDCKSEALKRMIPDRGKGNEYWSWKEMKDLPDQGTFLTYASKGIHAPKFIKNISPDIVDQARSRWEQKRPKQPKMEIPRSEFDILLSVLTDQYKANVPSVITIKKDICKRYLLNRKAVPRTGDLNRYAHSIHIILISDHQKNDSDKAQMMDELVHAYVIYETEREK